MTVTVSLTKNEVGFVVMNLSPYVGEGMTLVDLGRGDLCGGTFGKNVVLDAGSENITDTGVLFTFTATVDADTALGTEVEAGVIFRSAGSLEVEELGCAVKNATVTIQREPELELVASAAETLLNPGDTTTVTATLTKNEKGFMSIIVSPLFDGDLMTLGAIAVGDLCSGTVGGKNIVYDAGDADCVETGVLFSFTVTVQKDAPLGDVVVGVIYREGGNQAEQVLTCAVTNVTLTITDACLHRSTSVVEAVASTCTTHGHEAYTVCDKCGEVLEGNAGELPLDPDNHVHTSRYDVVPATTLTKGFSGNLYCDDCGKLLEEGTETPYLEENIPADAAQIRVSSKTVNRGKTFTVTLEVKNNPGFMTLELTPVIPDEFALIEVKNGSLILDFTEGEKQWLWTADGNMTQDGVLVTLTLVADNEADLGEYMLGFLIRGCYDNLEEAVDLASGRGVITVANVLWGDANDDGKINSQDIIRLKNYLANYNYDTGTSTYEVGPGADANGDGKINSQDIIRLKNYLANYNYETGTSTYTLGPSA